MELTPELIDKIRSFNLPQLLSYVIVTKLVGPALDFAQNRIKELSDEGKYGFTPSETEAKSFYKLRKSDIYRRFSECLGDHWSRNLILLGLHITHLNKNDKREIIDRVRSDVYGRHGKKGIRITELGSTGAIVPILGFLSDLKLKGANSDDLKSEFDNIIADWQNITVFVEADDSKKHILNEISALTKRNKPQFFVFAYGSAIDNTVLTIAELNNKKFFRKNRYVLFSSSRTEGNKPVYMCVFEKFGSQLPTLG